jgi:hypothetical protein
VLRAASLALVLAALSGACATVRPHERQRLASPSMQPPFGEPGVAEHDDKTVQTRTGGALPGAVAGGGCGCTQ